MNPGIHNVTMAEYLALKALSASLCNTLLAASPLHAKHAQDNPRDDPNEASDIGTAIHDCLLEGLDRLVPIAAPDWRTKAAKEARDEARSQGRIPMLEHKVDQIKSAMAAARHFIDGSEIAGVFDAGKPEQTLIWTEESFNKNTDRFGTDTWCKARPDWLNDTTLLHVKTTAGSAEPNSWIRNHLIPAGYDVTAAFYDRGATVLGLQVQSVFLVIEQVPPHGCSLIGLSPALADLAARKADRAIRMWHECVLAGRFPGYPDRICYADPFAWDEAQLEEREMIDPIQAKEGFQP